MCRAICFILLTIAVVGTTEKLRKRVPRVVGPTVQPRDAYLFRYQVAFQENCGQNCGGTIISDRIIITAAHCVFQSDPKTVTVKAGITDLDDVGQVVDVLYYRVHQGFTYSHNDIAILVLQNKLNLDLLTVADLPEHNQDFTGEIVYASGWGSSSNLTYTTLRVAPKFVCNHESHLCAEQTIANTTLYKGDSGGPLVLRRGNRVTLVGIAASIPLGYQRFTSVSNLRPWIDAAIAEASYITRFIDSNINSLKNHNCNS